MTSSITSSANLNLATLTNAQGFSIIGNQGSENGWSVAGAGDVNGDGCSDIIVGAYETNSYAGKSYIIYGNFSALSQINLSNLSTSQGFYVNGIFSSYSGISVSGAGDVNSDGYDDIIIGAPYAYCNSGQLCGGASFIIYGNLSLPLEINLNNLELYGITITGSIQEGQLGNSVSKAGDVNKDGFDDVIIGAPNANAQAGTSYVIYGNASLPFSISLASLSALGFAIVGEEGASTGYSVSSAGDVNGDGYDDIIIGAPNTYRYINDDYGGGNDITYGETYVIYGNISFPAVIKLTDIVISQGFSIIGVDNSQSGFSVSGAGDVNNDGYDDIIIGAPNANDAAGISYVIYGNKSLPFSINLANLGEYGFSIIGVDNSQSAYSVSGAGDINNDGYDDIIIGAPNANAQAGTSYVIYGNKSLPFNINLANLDEYGFSIVGIHNSQSGFSVSGIGDVNNDTYADIIIGAPSVARSYAIYGEKSGFETAMPISYPSSIPTCRPTTMPTPPTLFPTSQPSELSEGAMNGYRTDSSLNSVELRLVFSAASFAASLIGGWLLRNKVAFYILDNCGHKYKLIYNYSSQEPLKDNEIGLSLDADQLTCTVKGKKYSCPVGDNNHGISQSLHKVITQVLENPSASQDFKLLSYEKNQLRDFLIANKYITAEKTYCFLKSYKELGYIKGTIYNLFLSQFELEHSRIAKKHIRLEMDKQISMQTIEGADTDNPILNNVESDDNRASSELSRDQFSIKSKFVRPSDESADHLCIDTLMSPKYVALRDKRFDSFVKKLTYVVQETTDSHSKLLSIDRGISSSNNIDYSSIAHFTQNVLEYSSTARYFFKLLGIDVPKVDLPNEFWTGVHFIAGIVKIGSDSVLSLGQMLESISYYARLELYDMLAEANTDEKLTDLISFAQACSKHIAIGGVLGLASDAPVYGAINGAAMCLNQHHMLEDTDTQTAVRYAVDVVAGVAALYGLADQDALTQVISIVSAVSMSDITARVGMATVELELNGVSE